MPATPYINKNSIFFFNSCLVFQLLSVYPTLKPFIMVTACKGKMKIIS